MSSIIEFVLTGSFQYSFIVTYLGVFFIGPFLRMAINDFFKQFHIKKVVRSLLIPWILFGIVFLYVQIYFLLYYFRYNTFVGFGPVAVFIFVFGIIVLTLISINHFIRILAVSFHRRKSELFPINRREYASLQVLYQEGQMKFTQLKNRIRGIINVFMPEVYFDEKTSVSSIYQLCSIRFADINENFVVSLTNQGKTRYKIWKDTLESQIKKYSALLNSKGVLIRSFIGLLIFSLLKISIGTFSSESLRAEGIENFLDCIAVVLIGVGIRFKKERVVNIILTILMCFAGVSIIFESITSLIIGPLPIEVPQIAIIISIASIFLNTYLRVLKNFVGKKNRNSSLVASAIDSRVNIILSIGIILGALLSEFGRSQGLPILYYFDPIIALIISYFIFREAYEIFMEFIKGQGEELEFEKFQMSYEENFKEYVIKWILLVCSDNATEKINGSFLEAHFEDSLKKSEEIYTSFAYFGLYHYKAHGIESVVKNLINQNILFKGKDGFIELTEKGTYLHDEFYSKPILEDIKDPFDFFFEESYDFDSLRQKKLKLLEIYSKSNENNP